MNLESQTCIKKVNSMLTDLNKSRKYEKFKVKEYWVLDPVNKTALIFKMNKEGIYGKPEIFAEDGTVKVSIFDDLTVNLTDIFEM